MFFPIPPKAILATTIAMKHPINVISIGKFDGKLKASNSPVIIADKSLVVFCVLKK